MLHSPVTINSTAISLSWNITTNCTGVITGYIVQYTGGITTVTTDTSIVINGLIEFTQYSFSVAAINDNGIGPYSNERTYFTGYYIAI